MSIIAVAAVGVIAVFLAVQLKGMKGEYGFYLSAAAGLFILFYGIRKLEGILTVINEIREAIRLNQVYFITLMKLVGITYIGEFASGICRDNGYGFLGNQIEIFGKLAVMLLSLPILMTLLNTIREFLS